MIKAGDVCTPIVPLSFLFLCDPHEGHINKGKGHFPLPLPPPALCVRVLHRLVSSFREGVEVEVLFTTVTVWSSMFCRAQRLNGKRSLFRKCWDPFFIPWFCFRLFCINCQTSIFLRLEQDVACPIYLLNALTSLTFCGILLRCLEVWGEGLRHIRTCKVIHNDLSYFVESKHT